MPGKKQTKNSIMYHVTYKALPWRKNEGIHILNFVNILQFGLKLQDMADLI